MMNNFKYEMEGKQPPEKTVLLITKEGLPRES